MATYQITPDSVQLSRNWGLTFCDYSYTDVDKISGNPQKVKVDFQDLMVRVCSRRAVVVEGEVTPMTVRMRARNAYLADLGTILSKLTKAQATFSGDDNASSTAAHGLTADELKMLRDLPGASSMIAAGSTTATKADYEGLVQAVKTAMDKENNLAQTDMTRLQSLVDSRDDSYSAATNMMSAISDTRSNLIQTL